MNKDHIPMPGEKVEVFINGIVEEVTINSRKEIITNVRTPGGFIIKDVPLGLVTGKPRIAK